MNLLFKLLPIKDKYNTESPLFLFSSMLLITFLVVLTFSISLFLNTQTSLIVNFSNFFNSIVILFCFWFTRTERDVYWSVRIILSVALVFHFCTLWFTGGLYSFGFIWTILIILGAYFFSGIRLGILFTCLVLTGIGFYYTMEKVNLWSLQKSILSIDPEVVLTIRCSVIVVLSVMLYTFVKSKESLQRKNKELTENIVSELSDLLEIKAKELSSLRDKIAQDFHDEMGNKLASITILSQTIGLQVEQNHSTEEIKQTLAVIEQRSKELYLGTKHFIWALDVKSDFVIELFICLREFCEQFFSELNIDFTAECFFEKDSDLKMHTASSRQIILVCKEIMTNAAKHSKCGGVVLVFKNINHHLVIDIIDNGIGFDNLQVEKRGLLNIEKRLDNIGAHRILKSSQEGTSYQVFVPLVS